MASDRNSASGTGTATAGEERTVKVRSKDSRRKHEKNEDLVSCELVHINVLASLLEEVP